MTETTPDTCDHRGPVHPEVARRRAALVGAFPRPFAIALPEMGAVVGRGWFAEHGVRDTEISSRHLRMDGRVGALRVADAGSRNGTWVNGNRLGAHDETPLDDGSVVRIGRTLFVYREELLGSLDPSPALGGLIGPYGLRSVAQFLEGLTRSRPSNLLVEGETGVGKELVARAVAAALGRGESPFAAVNVAAVARGVFESQLFGHTAGSFSGAKGGSPGVVASHDRGTIFLDEIGDLDLDLQVKLLRFLENREILPVGAERARSVDVVVVAATNRDLEAMVERAAFRRDLYARLAMARVRVPALRHRREDIVCLAGQLALRFGAGFTTDQVEVEAAERLILDVWPHNVRQLDAVLREVRRLDPTPGLRMWAVEEVMGPAEVAKSALTQANVETALQASGGNLSEAAKILGVSRGKLIRFRKRVKSE